MQRWIEQPDGRRQPVHLFEDLGEVLTLQWQQCLERLIALLGRMGQDHPLDELSPVTEEHVLGPAQADALRAEVPSPCSVLRGVSVGTHHKPAD